MYCEVKNGCNHLLGGAGEACWAHNPKVRGSKPLRANFWCILERTFDGTPLILKNKLCTYLSITLISIGPIQFLMDIFDI